MDRASLGVIALVVLFGGILFSLAPRPAHAMLGQCTWEGGQGAPTYPYCQTEDCLGANGVALCTEPEIRPPEGTPEANADGAMFTYGMCDLQGPTIGSAVRWCMVEGGTWTAAGTCTGLSSPFDTGGPGSESLAVSTSDAWETFNPGPCSPSMTADSGWGYDDSGDQLCGGSTTYKNGYLISDVRKRTWTPPPSCGGNPSMLLTKHRQLKCPHQDYQRTLPNGDIQCYIPIEVCLTCANPVSPVTGAKIEAAIDYRGGGAGGLELGHYYNSQSRFRMPGTGAFLSGLSDYWHFSYDRHLTPITGKPGLMAVVQRESGAVDVFDGSGHEVFNRTGAAGRLVSNGSSGWSLTLENNDVETYNAAGNLTAITRRDGLTTTISYNGAGKISQVADPFGHKLIYTYSGDQLASVTLPDGSSTVSYGYDNRGRLISVTYADGSSLTYQYEDLRNGWLLTGITDELSQRYATYRYDSSELMSHEEHAGGVAAYDFSIGSGTFNGGLVITTVTDPLRQSRTYALDNPSGVHKLRSIYPYCADCPNVLQSSFDANGNYQSKTDLNGNQVLYTYDQARNLETSRTEGKGGAGQTTPATRTITTQWHATLRLPTQVSVYAGATASGTSLRTTTTTYDGYGNVLTRTVADGATGASRTWTYTYYNSGLYGQVHTIDGPRTDVTDTTVYTYYSCATGYECGQVHTVTDALGHVVTYGSYDANGMPLSMTDANGTVTTMTYDSRQRLKTRTVDGELTTFDYYSTGLAKKVTMPDGSYLSYIYDAAHRLTEVDDALGDRIVYTLDAAGNRQGEKRYDSSGTLARSSAQLYNVLGQIWQDLTSSGTDSEATVYTYDSGGNQTGISAPLGRNTSYTYDELGRQKQVTDSGGGISSFAYDANDNLTSVTDPRQLLTQYTYNGLGDLQQLSSPDTGTTQSTFDSGGNVHTTTDARGEVATYSYDALNRVTQVSFSDQTFAYTYDQGTNGIGRLSTVADGSGHTGFAYDTRGRVVQKVQAIGGVSLTVGYGYTNSQLTSLTTPSGQALVYTYDASGQVLGISVNGATLVQAVHYSPFGPAAGWTWGNGTSSNRSYDLDGRPTQITSAGGSSYSFYDDGTISSRSDDSESDYSVVPGTTTVAIASTSNRIATTTGTLARTYSYDSAGNTASTGSQTFTYNAAGRMQSGALSGTPVTFAVNALGQRLKKASAGATTLFAYDQAGHLLGEYSATGALVQETVWLGDIPVATLRPNGTGGVNVFYVHTDHLNTPRRITRPSDNATVWRWSSDPFGGGFVDSDPDGDGQSFVYNLRFAGQYADAETGVNYNYFRDYDPYTGRYIQSDPIGLGGGNYSTYGYADENPVSSSDPMGLYVKLCSRLLGNPKSKATARLNPIRHDYLEVSGQFIGFYSAPGANPAWGQGVVAGQNERDGGRCTSLCNDSKFDAYVLAAAQEIGAPTYCAMASAEFGLSGLAAEAAGARNCQSWARDVIAKAKQNYLAHGNCPTCFKN